VRDKEYYVFAFHFAQEQLNLRWLLTCSLWRWEKRNPAGTLCGKNTRFSFVTDSPDHARCCFPPHFFTGGGKKNNTHEMRESVERNHFRETPLENSLCLINVFATQKVRIVPMMVKDFCFHMLK